MTFYTAHWCLVFEYLSKYSNDNCSEYIMEIRADYGCTVIIMMLVWNHHCIILLVNENIILDFNNRANVMLINIFVY